MPTASRPSAGRRSNNSISSSAAADFLYQLSSGGHPNPSQKRSSEEMSTSTYDPVTPEMSEASSFRSQGRGVGRQGDHSLSVHSTSASSFYSSSGQDSSPIDARSYASSQASSATRRARRAANITDTPRKGRRMGKVDLGWNSPAAAADFARTFEQDTTMRPGFGSPSELTSLGSGSSYDETFDEMPARRSGNLHGATPGGGAAAARARTAAFANNRLHGDTPIAKDRSVSQRIVTKAALLDRHGWATAQSLQQEPDASALAYLAAAVEGDMPNYIDWDAGESSSQYQQPDGIVGRSSSVAGLYPSSSTANDLLEDYLVGFKSDSASQADSQQRSSPTKMVAVHIEGHGRIAVLRDLAPQISRIKPSVAHSASAASINSDGSSASGSGSYSGAASSSQLSNTVSDASISTQATTAVDVDMTPCLPGDASADGPSPSFSIASHFPASECGSPSLHAVAAQRMEHDRPTAFSLGPSARLPQPTARPILSKEEKAASVSTHVHALRNVIAKAQQAASAASPESGAATVVSPPPFKPRLSHSVFDVQARLPSLNWPDAPGGPWAGALEHATQRRNDRWRASRRGSRRTRTSRKRSTRRRSSSPRSAATSPLRPPPPVAASARSTTCRPRRRSRSRSSSCKRSSPRRRTSPATR